MLIVTFFMFMMLLAVAVKDSSVPNVVVGIFKAPWKKKEMTTTASVKWEENINDFCSSFLTATVMETSFYF